MAEKIASDKITLHLAAKTGITEALGNMECDPAETLGKVLFRIKKKLKRPALYLFLMRGSEGFIPTPDQTIGSLLHAYAESSDQRHLSFAVSTAIFHG
ncbi:Ubiquitin-like autophagy protein Apg12 [Trypanosoma brucei equiperdum]|uniref:Ubiquitin-like autophagy protein Apg12 n=1 Tax=Trypanosoma brucei equiperdum TaxID=630700 RepID=A0A3L6KSX6_9TRYP|nr:Ubiquitin-like autophagy protein Apg12 [Trypanosoma brucei equiperdum]